MLRLHSFLQSIYSFLQNISKRMYRTCAIIATGTIVVSVIALNANGFGGSGKNRVFAFQTQEAQSNQEEEEEIEADTKAKIQTEMPQADIDTQSITTDVPEATRFVIISAYAQFHVFKEQHDKEEQAKAEKAIREELILKQAKEELQRQLEAEQELAKIEAEESMEAQEAELAEPVLMTKPAISVSDYEYDILIHIVAAEAGGCDMIGQILVANVVLNRVNDSAFPDSIEAVVYQKNQFSPVVYGTLWKTKVTDTTREAVNRALAGEDYSKGALFFSARARLGDESMSWFDNNLHWLFEHDGHEFYKFKE